MINYNSVNYNFGFFIIILKIRSHEFIDSIQAIDFSTDHKEIILTKFSLTRRVTSSQLAGKHPLIAHNDS
jgi:hypothetical protein